MQRERKAHLWCRVGEPSDALRGRTDRGDGQMLRGEIEERLVGEACEKLLSNPIMERFEFRVFSAEEATL